MTGNNSNAHEQVKQNEWWFIHTMEYHSALKGAKTMGDSKSFY